MTATVTDITAIRRRAVTAERLAAVADPTGCNSNIAEAAVRVVRVLTVIKAGRRPHPADRRAVQAAERRGYIARDPARRLFVLTDSGRALAARL